MILPLVNSKEHGKAQPEKNGQLDAQIGPAPSGSQVGIVTHLNNSLTRLEPYTVKLNSEAPSSIGLCLSLAQVVSTRSRSKTAGK